MSETQAAATNYVVIKDTVIAFADPNVAAEISGTFTFDAATSTESNVNLFLAPREPNSPIVRGFYSQSSPLKTSSSNSIIATAAGVRPACTIELYWVIANPPMLIFAQGVYNNGATGQRLVGACGGGAVPAT